jgi:hypothetical protein
MCLRGPLVERLQIESVYAGWAVCLVYAFCVVSCAQYPLMGGLHFPAMHCVGSHSLMHTFAAYIRLVDV